MKVVKKISERPDLWYGNNQILICKDEDGRFWLVHNNDAYPPDHPYYMEKKYEVEPVEVTETKYVRKNES